MTRVRRRNHRLDCEALESRQLLSAYYLINASSTKLLDDPNSSTSNGAVIDQWQPNSGANQQWDLVQLANGNYEVFNASSGKVLDDPDFSTGNGTPVIQSQPNGGLDQQWQLVPLANGDYEVFNASSRKVLDDPAFSTNNGTPIIQYQLNGGLNQQWQLVPLANSSGSPTASTGYSPAPASAQLFNNGGPSYLDVEQGQAGDCWLLASLAEVAARDPQDIRNMFTYDGTIVDNGATVGLYTVRFFNTSGSAVSVQVDTELPSGGEHYDHVDNDLGTQALWVALAEKAYAVANGLGYVTTSHENQDSYKALNGGWPSWALHAITGKPASEYSINPTNIASAWNAGQLVVLCTGTPTSSDIVGHHCYAVVGYNASIGLSFDVFNPWGTQSNGWAPGETDKIYGLFASNAAFISQNFDESATLVDGYASSGTATVHGNGSSSTATGYTRPAQGPATGTDQRDASLTGYVNNTSASPLDGPVAGAVVNATSPTLARTRSYNRKL
jgi:hypothetical protein